MTHNFRDFSAQKKEKKIRSTSLDFSQPNKSSKTFIQPIHYYLLSLMLVNRDTGTQVNDSD